MPGREIEIINMNEPYLWRLHAREILLLIILSVENEQILCKDSEIQTILKASIKRISRLTFTYSILNDFAMTLSHCQVEMMQ